MNDFTMKTFVEACEEKHLEGGQGVAGKTLAGKALLSNSMYFDSDVSKLKVEDYPFLCNVWEFGLHAVVAIKLANTYMSSVDYALEIFLPPMEREIAEQKHLINGVLSILKNNCRKSWEICGENLRGITLDLKLGQRRWVHLTRHQLILLGALHRYRQYQTLAEVGEQNSTFGPAAGLGPHHEMVDIDRSHFNTGTTSKRRRTSEVWQSFDEHKFKSVFGNSISKSFFASTTLFRSGSCTPDGDCGEGGDCVCVDCDSGMLLEEEGCGCVCGDCDSRSMLGEEAANFDGSCDVVRFQSWEKVAKTERRNSLTKAGPEIAMVVLYRMLELAKTSQELIDRGMGKLLNFASIYLRMYREEGSLTIHSDI
ncbi:unnamed protein product [Dovyalis caffra]|uniref:NLP1-9 GAF domain-containing protein n=1 Tax=Dovyalis caffra TaxID=77055 RepID=A0AAV1QMG3_9ROSI|nr:unnamed protein product [Dovyalis caffra]